MPTSRAQVPAADYVAMPTADGQAVSGAGVLLGVSITETDGAACKVNLHDGTSASGQLILSFKVSANGSETVWLGPGGVNFLTGLYIDESTGAINDGAIFYHPS